MVELPQQIPEKNLRLLPERLRRLLLIFQHICAVLTIIAVRLLGLNTQPCVLLRDMVPLHDPLNPLLAGGQHRHRPAAQLPQAALHEVDGIQPHQHPSLHLPPQHAGEIVENDAVEPLQRLRIGKDETPQLLPIQLRPPEHLTKGLPDAAAQGFVLPQGLMIYGIAV